MSKHDRRRQPSRPAPAAQPAQGQIDRAIALCYEGKRLFHANDFSTAIHRFKEAVQLVPHINNAHYMLAECYWHTGQVSKARRATEAELEWHPDNLRARDLLAGLRAAPQGPQMVGMAFDQTEPPLSWPSVSLCMIVKDEEKYLAGCLESVRDFASEIIVVDTGSSDRTVEIARSFGARLEFFPWINDFAAARNESIRHATCDWIFWMDADDRLPPQSLIHLKHAAASGAADAFDCVVVSPVALKERSVVTSNHIRLFRNRLGLQFEDPIHETVFPSIMRHGLTLAFTNITIEHTGYIVSDQTMKDKARRNQAILQDRLAHEPGNLYWRYHLGIGRYILEDWEGAIAELEPVIADPPDIMHMERDIYQAHVLVATAYACLRRDGEARRAFDRATALFPNRRHLWITLGVFHMTVGEPEAATQALERARTLSPGSDRMGNSWAPGKLEEVLGQAYLWLGKTDRARQVYRDRLAAIGAPPGPISPAVWQRACALFDAGQYDQVIRELEGASQADPNGLRLLARAGLRMQQWERSCDWLQHAILLSEARRREWADLGGYLMKAGRVGSAERVARLALDNASTADERAAALNLLGIIAVHHEDAATAISNFVQAILADPGHQPAHDNLKAVAEQLGCSHWQAMRQEAQRLIHCKENSRAVDTLKLVLELAPQDGESFRLLALAFMEMGQEQQALACWQTAQRLECQRSGVV